MNNLSSLKNSILSLDTTSINEVDTVTVEQLKEDSIKVKKTLLK